MSTPLHIEEPGRQVPVVGEADVLVAGGGPAGFAAAVAAAREGARVILIETHGQLGGVWTSGLLSWIIDHENKRGLLTELLARLEVRGWRARRRDGTPTSAYDAEGMKLTLEELCEEAGVTVRLHTRVCAALRDDGRIRHVITESKSGREAWTARVFIDATGDGDLAARAGCGFDMGDERGRTMPMTMMALLCGLCEAEVRPFINGEGARWGVPHRALREAIELGGHRPSYDHPALFRIYDDLYALMANHEYGERADDAAGVTRATLRARRELHAIVAALRRVGGPWRDVRIVATPAQIGIREGRRVHGLYTVTVDDIRHGARHEDAICRATFCIDLHPPTPEEGGVTHRGIRSQPYDIPLRALIARDVDNLLLAGRCISGDYLAHTSYRVTGNACMMGQAAGVCAALAAREGVLPREVPAPEVQRRLPPIEP